MDQRVEAERFDFSAPLFRSRSIFQSLSPFFAFSCLSSFALLWGSECCFVTMAHLCESDRASCLGIKSSLRRFSQERLTSPPLPAHQAILVFTSA